VDEENNLKRGYKIRWWLGIPTELHMSEGRIGNLFGKFHTESGQSHT
jgi:hypothetical protein